MPNGDRVIKEFIGKRVERQGVTPSTRFEVRAGCYVTLFDDGRTKFTIDKVKSGFDLRIKAQDAHNLPEGGAAIETVR